MRAKVTKAAKFDAAVGKAEGNGGITYDGIS